MFLIIQDHRVSCELQFPDNRRLGQNVFSTLSNGIQHVGLLSSELFRWLIRFQARTGHYGLVAIKNDSNNGPMQQDPRAFIKTIISWSQDARKAIFWKMDLTINSTAPVAIDSRLLITNQPVVGTTGASTWLERGN